MNNIWISPLLHVNVVEHSSFIDDFNLLFLINQLQIEGFDVDWLNCHVDLFEACLGTIDQVVCDFWVVLQILIEMGISTQV